MPSTMPRLAGTLALFLLASCQFKDKIAQEQSVASQAEPRTVFGEPPRPEQARQRTTSPQLAPPGPQQQQPRDEVATMLYRWAQTYSSRDLRRHMTLYAQRLDRFYDRTDVRRASVRSEKQRVLTRHSRTRGQQIRDVSLNEEDGGRIVIAEFQRTGEQAGQVRQRLVWKRLGPGEWRIIREELL